MKSRHILFSLAIGSLFIFGAGCNRRAEPVKTEVPVIEPVAAEPESLPELTDEDSSWIQKNIEAGTIPVGIRFSNTWSIPNGVRLSQLQNHVYQLAEGTAFAFVNQRNGNTVLYRDANGELDTDPVSFAGVLFTKDNGKTWGRSFTIPTSTLMDASGTPVRLNAVGLWYDKKGSYVLDIEDGRGVGVGEGNLIRFRTADGRTWIKDAGCYYFIPKSYYNKPNGAGSSSSLNPNPNMKLMQYECPDYLDRM
jgi:hypothetical protein